MSGRHFSAVDLEVLWSRLITAVDEAAYAILRTSMSKIVVEARDFGALLLGTQGQLLVPDAGVDSHHWLQAAAATGDRLQHGPRFLGADVLSEVRQLGCQG